MVSDFMALRRGMEKLETETVWLSLSTWSDDAWGCGFSLLYQRPIKPRKKAPITAATPNQIVLTRPKGRIIKAASNGPIEDPTRPPTWNIDWAIPLRPPEAKWATRDDSG